jgi:catechol 2,3-dioxygenase-like lactoylglutathione lyase family enzyme
VITALDHVPVVVENLDAAVSGFTTLFGRGPDWRGRYPGARHAWFQLSNMAIDVIGPDGDGGAGEETRARLAKHGEGPTSLGWTVRDLGEAVSRIERRGLTVAGRGVTTSEGDGGERRWDIAMLKVRPTGGLPMFLVGGESAPPGGDFELDHVVVNTADPERAIALYGGRLGLDLRLDRAQPQWGSRMLFFRVGGVTIEVVAPLQGGAPETRDRIGGLAWRVADVAAEHARMAAAGLNVSDVRTGRKPGTRVFTVRDAPAAIPTLVIGADPPAARAARM